MVAFHEIQLVSDRIAREFRPEKIILFGSHAYGVPTEDSDVDLLVILPFEGSGLRKSVEILTRVSPTFPIDLIARRPDDTDQRLRAGDPLIHEAMKRGRVLYERQN